MNVMKEVLLQKLEDTEQKNREKVKQDSWRLGYHLMPLTGWMNDPNGLCQYKGKYYIFFQYAPFNPEGGLKMWGEYSSKDLIHWEYEGVPILPDSPYDCHGVYSGCALTDDEKMEIFYTGNIKYDGDYDYIHEGRNANIIYTASEDGKQFEPKECLLSMEDYPSGYTNHIRDPKVWKQNGEYYMVLGGRKSNNQGAVLLFFSKDKKKWEFKSEFLSEQPFGYMWECPDLFEIGGNWILSISPQGLKREKYRYQNIYQSGWFLIGNEWSKGQKVKEFQEWDMGFDFYAPQTFLDEKERRILIAWAGMPDSEEEYQNPTVERGWQHTLTVPRELGWKNGKIYQYPVEEISQLRREVKRMQSEQEILWEEPWFDWEITEISSEKCMIIIEKECIFSYENGICLLEFKGTLGAGRQQRRAYLSQLHKIRILGDASMLEIYLNDGECVFTTRFYPKGMRRYLQYKCSRGLSSVWKMEIEK